MELSVEAGGLVVLDGGLPVGNDDEVLAVVRAVVLAVVLVAGSSSAGLTPPKVPHPKENMCGVAQV